MNLRLVWIYVIKQSMDKFELSSEIRYLNYINF